MNEEGVDDTFHIEGVLKGLTLFVLLTDQIMTFLEKYLTFLNRQHTVKS